MPSSAEVFPFSQKLIYENWHIPPATQPAEMEIFHRIEFCERIIFNWILNRLNEANDSFQFRKWFATISFNVRQTCWTINGTNAERWCVSANSHRVLYEWLEFQRCKMQSSVQYMSLTTHSLTIDPLCWCFKWESIEFPKSQMQQIIIKSMTSHRFSQNSPITIHVALHSAHSKCYTKTNGEQQTINRKLDNTW